MLAKIYRDNPIISFAFHNQEIELEKSLVITNITMFLDLERKSH